MVKGETKWWGHISVKRENTDNEKQREGLRREL